MQTISLIEQERQAITVTVQQYIDGAKSGRSDDMKPAFHDGATIFGYAGENLFAGPIQQLMGIWASFWTAA